MIMIFLKMKFKNGKKGTKIGQASKQRVKNEMMPQKSQRYPQTSIKYFLEFLQNQSYFFKMQKRGRLNQNS